MAIYEYKCSNCEKKTEVIQKFEDDAPEKCPHCEAQKTLTRQVSGGNFQLQGSGWYVTDYGKNK